MQAFTRIIAASGITVLDMPKNTSDLDKLMAGTIANTVAQYGITISELYTENISLPPAVEAALNTHTSRSLTGNLDAHMKYTATETLRYSCQASSIIKAGISIPLANKWARRKLPIHGR